MSPAFLIFPLSSPTPSLAYSTALEGQGWMSLMGLSCEGSRTELVMASRMADPKKCTTANMGTVANVVSLASVTVACGFPRWTALPRGHLHREALFPLMKAQPFSPRYYIPLYPIPETPNPLPVWMPVCGEHCLVGCRSFRSLSQEARL